MKDHQQYIGKHHHQTTALATIAGNGLPLGLMPEARADSDTVAFDIDLSSNTPCIRLQSDHDAVLFHLSPRDVERIFDEVAKVMARSQVELRVVDSETEAAS
jgi:hypothetical protein